MPQFDTSCRDCVYAQAYVPDHKACQLFSGEDALKNGTAFPELAMPYTKGRNLKHFGGEERA
ncbi:MAG: spore coat associated protein CotJA [Lachnospiraceae bacterium]|nr:spore coat associated protein CotJA [Lachnospiraceae bacterium]